MDAERGRSVQIQKKLRIRTKQISLRCATAALMALAALNMALNKQVSDFGSVKMEANYSSLSAFRSDPSWNLSFFVIFCGSS